MRTRTIAALVSLMLAGCATTQLSPEAQRIHVTDKPADVGQCRLVGVVNSQPPYVTPNDGRNQLLNNAAALGADTLLLTSTGVVRGKTGSAYVCGSAAK